MLPPAGSTTVVVNRDEWRCSILCPTHQVRCKGYMHLTNGESTHVRLPHRHIFDDPTDEKLRVCLWTSEITPTILEDPCSAVCELHHASCEARLGVHCMQLIRGIPRRHWHFSPDKQRGFVCQWEEAIQLQSQVPAKPATQV
jgi:hypothetical protein